MDGEKMTHTISYSTTTSRVDSPYFGESSNHQESLPRRILESFKRDPTARATPKGSLGADGKVFDVEAAAQATAESPLARRLRGRHLQMIAIGGSIGTITHQTACGIRD